MRRLALLMFLAAAPAAAGCVTVPPQEPAPAPALGAAPGAVPDAARPTVPLPDRSPALLPRSPQRESSATAGPEPDRLTDRPRPAGTTLRARQAAPQEPPAAARAAPRSGAGAPHSPAAPSRPRPRTAPGTGVPRPRAGAGAGAGARICEMGRAFDRWREDSDSSRICESHYGR